MKAIDFNKKNAIGKSTGHLVEASTDITLVLADLNEKITSTIMSAIAYNYTLGEGVGAVMKGLDVSILLIRKAIEDIEILEAAKAENKEESE